MAYVAYIAVTAALAHHLVVRDTDVSMQGSMSAEPSAGMVASRSRRMLTITVDGPIGPLKLYCTTTTDAFPSGHVDIDAADLVVFYKETCEHDSPD